VPILGDCAAQLQADPKAGTLNRNHWLIPLGIAVLAILCFYLVICGVAGTLLRRANTLQAAQDSATPTVQEAVTVPTPILRQPLAAERQTALEVEQTPLPDRDLLDLARRLQGASASELSTGPSTPRSHQLGERQTFWLHNVDSNSFFTTTAVLQYGTPHAYWWIEEGYQVPQRGLERSARNFENDTYPTNRRYFGSEWNPGIDADPHIYIFLGDVPGVGGYFSSPDEYPIQVRPRSNEHEMFYINLDNAMPGDDYFDGILAHEFQHMIHWAMDRDENTWVSEGLSELAGQINNYDVGGSDWLYTREPDTQLTDWPDLEHSGPNYGASYLFLAYFLEQYGEQAVRQLVSEQADGIAGFDAVLEGIDPARRQFRDLFTDWVIANYLDDTTLDKGRYGYKALQIDRPAHSAHHTTYPVQEAATVGQYAADYILLDGDGTLTIDFIGSQVVSLLGNEPHSGEYQWCAVRGDEGDATLTRAFDLSELQQATLQAWVWYDLEADYDYAYVEISSDGGQTWKILGNQHTTDTNPSGNSYGPAFTGLSGKSQEPHWVRESFDLTPYAGQPVLIRFEVVTDESVNHPGFCLDDITISQLDYRTDVEAGNDDWQAEGWVRVTGHIPQEFVVQLVTLGRDAQVQPMALDEQMRGSMTVAGLGTDIDQAVLVVSGLAPSTTEPASYSYQITQQ
jgi:immune inhibitor A